MRLAVVGPTYPIKGGISHYTTLLVRALRKRHEVLFVSYEYQYPACLYPGTAQAFSKETPIIEESEPLWHTLKPWSLTRIAKRMKGFGAEGVVLTWITHFFGWHIGQLAKAIRRNVPSPIVMICHNVRQHEGYPLEGCLTRMAFRGPHGFLVHSTEDRENLLRMLPDAKVRKAHHPTYDIFATSSNWTREGARAALGLNDEPMVLYFGAVRPYKGLKWLIEAAPAIMATVPGCQMWCVGDYWSGPDEFQRRSKELGVTFDPANPDRGGVRIVAQYTPNDEVGKYFHASDLVVLPYETATQSGIVQIAYGFDKPCLVTNVGGLPEVVLDGKTGYIVPPKDARAIAMKTAEFFAGGAELQKRMQGEIEEFREVFDWDHMVNTIEEFVTELSRA